MRLLMFDFAVHARPHSVQFAAAGVLLTHSFMAAIMAFIYGCNAVIHGCKADIMFHVGTAASDGIVRVLEIAEQPQSR
eukprot:1659939-Rhodomonas_salina.1